MERCDELEINNYKIYQDTDYFCFGMDSVLLANFAIRNFKNKFNKKLFIADLCTGNIAISLIMYAKRIWDMNIIAIDIDDRQLQLAKKSLELNSKIDTNIQNDIKLIHDDINNILINKEKYKLFSSQFDFITINPPYIKMGNGIDTKKNNLLYARNEITLNLDIICKVSYNMLKSNKSFFMVHRTKRFSEIIWTLRQNKLEPKTIQFIHSNINKPSNLFLVEAVKDGGEETRVLSPIIVYNEDLTYTKEVLEIYGK